MKITIDGMAWLPKADLSVDQLSWLKKTLTITQQVSREYANRSKPAIVQLWKDSPDQGSIGIPREFFFENLMKKGGHEIEYKVSRGLPWPNRLEPELIDGKLPEWANHRSNDPGELTLFDTVNNQPVALRPGQTEAINLTMERFANKEMAGGIICSATGTGKTMISLEIIRKLKLPAAVLVHREFVANQWKKFATRFMPDAKVGMIAGDEIDIEGCHIVIIMLQTIVSWLNRDKFKIDLADRFGLTCNEETHRAPSPTWSQVIPVFNAAYRIGISANPKRSDGLGCILDYHIGSRIYTGTSVMMTPKIRRVWTAYKIDHPRLNPSMLSMEFAFKHMSKDQAYNQDVVNQVKQAVEAGRKILVYSHTIEHLKTLRKMLDEQLADKIEDKSVTIDFYIGGMKEEQLDAAAECIIILGSYQMAKDSLDIPSLDTVVLAGPIRNPQQPAGRACREYANKKPPIVVDMRADNVPVFKSYGESRDHHYAKLYNDDYLTKKLVK
jgi:superfamily II DNA or RNA helicase